MKRNPFFFLALLISFSLTWTACDKDDDHHHHHHDTDPEITILSPTEGQEFHHGEVPIHADISWDQELHGWEIILTKKSDGAELYKKDSHVHGESLEIRETWTNELEHHTDVVLEVIVAKSHSGDDKVSAKVEFHCHAH
jgi:hypothetical protein